MADLIASNQTSVTLVTSLYSKVSNFAVAIIILLAGLIIGRLAGRFIHKMMEEVELNRLLKRTTGIKFAVDEIVESIISYMIYFISIILALDQLGVATTILRVISLIFILFVIASVLLGVRDFIPNIIAGIFLAQRRLLSKGDRVKIGDIEGEIVEMNMIETRIVTRKGDIIYMPNAMLTKREVIKIKR